MGARVQGTQQFFELKGLGAIYMQLIFSAAKDLFDFSSMLPLCSTNSFDKCHAYSIRVQFKVKENNISS